MIRDSNFEGLVGIRHGFGTRGDEYPARVVTGRQVHGAEILELASLPSTEPVGFDAFITGQPGIPVAVKTADCLPILLVDPKQRVVAAVHAGWRGTVQRVVQKTVRRMIERGASLQNLHAALGPNMSGSCYEVGRDVQEIVEKEFPKAPVLQPKSQDKWFLDVVQLNWFQLIELGLSPDRISHLDLCTHCRPDLFESYRRDGEKSGRMINFIELV